jgi:Cof subfamily protein (haloacid dehalogenase superfamily)
LNKALTSPPSGIQLVAFDLDDTLMNSRKELPAGAVESFAAARKGGVRLSIITGRDVCSVIELAKILHLDGPHVSFGGALVTGNSGRPVYARHCFSYQVTRQIVEVCRRLNLMVYLGGSSQSLVEKGSVDLPHAQVPYSPCPPQLCQDVLADLHFKPLLITIHHANPDALEEARKELAGYSSEFTMTTATAKDIVITPRGVDKGSALRELAAVTGISLRHIMVIGDSPTDLPMFGVAGLAVAVTNATPEVKNAAHRIAPSNDEGGVLWAIQNLALSPTAIL